MQTLPRIVSSRQIVSPRKLHHGLLKNAEVFVCGYILPYNNNIEKEKIFLTIVKLDYIYIGLPYLSY